MAREYRDSGIEWIGQIPKGWEVIKLKYESQFINGYAFDSNDFKIDGEIRVVRIGDIGLSIDWDNCIYVKYPAFSLDTFKVSNGDILIAMSGATTGKCCLVTNAKEAYINQRVGIIRSDKRKYVFYSLLAPYFKEYVNLNNMGSAQPNISSKAIGEFPLVMPKSFSEQQKIADYLDKVCGEIDEMVALQETMIEELKAYKQSVITEAVTKGLNPRSASPLGSSKNVPMRNSGIDWIGEIPEHWDISRLKFYSSFINGYAFSSDIFTIDKGCKVIRIGDISQNLDFDGCVRADVKTDSLQQYRIITNDIVIAMSGATTGKCCIAKDVEEAYINQRVGIIRCDNYIYTYYQLQTDYFMEYIKLNNAGSAQPNISGSSIGNFPILVPPEAEQRTIASYLDTKCSEIDSLIALKQSKIEELKEYKKSVIYEYVTGKKEII